MTNCLIVGCGDVGRRLAMRLKADGMGVIGITRTDRSAYMLEAAGIAGRALDLDTALTAESLPLADARVFYFAPPPDTGESDPRLQKVLAAARAQRPSGIVYISTSGVYGDCHGAWVTEATPPNPITARARRRLHAEQQLLAYGVETGVRVSILRVGGIYGPGRLPETRIRQGSPVICPDEAPWSNRIHIEDLVSVCIAAAERGQPGAIYNVADAEPSTMTDYFYRVADALSLPRPPCVPLAQAADHLSPGMLSYVRESRRLDTNRLSRELRVELRYPSLSAGLPASLPAPD